MVKYIIICNFFSIQENLKRNVINPRTSLKTKRKYSIKENPTT